MENYTYYIDNEGLQTYSYDEIVLLIRQGVVRPNQRVMVLDNSGDKKNVAANTLL